ncbi:MAG: protoheme IX farnesyltransferase, partial [Pseudohongiellaceae bacterium]
MTEILYKQSDKKVASWRDYYEMCKPRVVMMMILTSLVGMFLAVPGMVSLNILIWGNLGIALVASAGAVVNHLIDHQVDTIMQRTIKRPIPQGKVSPTQALLFALGICLLGMLILIFLVNPLCAWLTLAS